MAAGTQFKQYEGPRIDFPYATRIGELLYAALGAHPEIAFAVQHLSQFTKNPGPEHLAAIKHLYRYLKGAADEGITYSRDGSDQPEIFVDADWAQDILDRHSISGHVFMLSGGAISWTSKKQVTVALSTLEAEYVALSLAVRHSAWLSQLFKDLDLPLHHPLQLWSDSASAIALA